MKRFIRPNKGLSSFLLLSGDPSPCSAFGSSMTSFALTVWSYQQHGSALSTALLAVSSYGPLCAAEPVCRRAERPLG